MTRLVVSTCLWFAVLALCGCGSGNQGPASPADMTGKERLAELGELWSLAQIDSGRAPAKIADLAKYNRAGGFAYRAVADGELIVVWGVKLGQGSAIFAHEKVTPTSGGWVMLQDRTIKMMSADEFKAVAKASP